VCRCGCRRLSASSDKFICSPWAGQGKIDEALDVTLSDIDTTSWTVQGIAIVDDLLRVCAKSS
jgi:hypothetical protein